MVKVGILTHYYQSRNYGGNLQAYALCRVIKKMGHSAFQIPYSRKYDCIRAGSFAYRIARITRKKLKTILTLIERAKRVSVYISLRIRWRLVDSFNAEIPHIHVCNRRNVERCNNEFDVFITGSDQVWHPSAVCGAYLLDFVKPEKAIKMSYAASIAMDQLPEHIIERYQNSLKDFSAISVRESEGVELLQPYLKQRVELVLDPTLLLSKSEWDEVNSGRFSADGYVFCFFLGDSKDFRRIAELYARKKGLRIYTIPYLSDVYRKCDEGFGDTILSDVSPGDFISLIENAAAVFTDSFHATVFSLIYQKEFFVFDRSIQGSMGSRIRGLVELFDVKEHFCDTPQRTALNYIESLEPIEYECSFEKFEQMKKKSLDYLVRNIEMVRRRKGYEAD